MAVAAAGGGIWTTPTTRSRRTCSGTRRPTTCRQRHSARSTYDEGSGTLYAGSGEPNGSSDSEAGLGLFKSTDFGGSWTQVPGSVSVATNRAIGAIVVDPTDPDKIYIGTAVARHGSSSVNGGRRTPPERPGARRVPLDRRRPDVRPRDRTSPARRWPTRRPAHRARLLRRRDLQARARPERPNRSTPPSSATGSGAPTSPAAAPTGSQVFHTMNQNDFTGPDFIGDSDG